MTIEAGQTSEIIFLHLTKDRSKMPVFLCLTTFQTVFASKEIPELR